MRNDNEFLELELMDRIEECLFELENSDGLTVCLVPQAEPANVGACNRAVMTQNPPWYQRFVSRYTNCRGRGRKRMRRPRTFISRVRVIQALRRMLDGDRSGIYAERLLEFIQRELANERSRQRQARRCELEETGERLPF